MLDIASYKSWLPLSFKEIQNICPSLTEQTLIFEFSLHFNEILSFGPTAKQPGKKILESVFPVGHDPTIIPMLLCSIAQKMMKKTQFQILIHIYMRAIEMRIFM